MRVIDSHAWELSLGWKRAPSGLARDLGGFLQFLNMPFGTSDD